MSRAKGSPKTGGRRPGSRNKNPSPIKAIAAEYGVEAINVLVDLMRNGDNAQVKRGAAETLLDRGFGKPTMTLDSEVNVTTRAVYHDPTAHLEDAAAAAIEVTGQITEAETL